MYRPARLESHRAKPFASRLLRVLAVLLVIAVMASGAAWYLAGRSAGPVINIIEPSDAVGQNGELEVLLQTPDVKLDQFDVVLEQQGRSQILYSLQRDTRTPLFQEGNERLRLVRAIGKRAIPELEEGRATLRVVAARPVLFGLRRIESIATRDFEVLLTPPSVTALSAFHYINLGGSEAVVYKVSNHTTASGVRVGSTEYLGYPASGAGIAHSDVGLRVAFFGLQWDQPPGTPITLFARDRVGNESQASFEFRVLPKTFRKGRIELDDRFLAKVVPPILQNSPRFRVDNPSDFLASYLKINRDLRRQNGETLAALARQTAPEMLWRGPFRQLVRSAVEGGFADQRTYFYNGKEVDRQVHLGFDLASTAMAPVNAANSGKVLHAKWLGIYGNCVVVDHGMGLQSLYAHLSSIAVKVGDSVKQGDLLGHSGSTGLAGGDHLHFTMLLGGAPVTPIDWWSPKWVQDRVIRKLREAEALGTGQRGDATALR
jgi:murein DD-endopeptidase MepM/ murein hydrolase activator NlpD